MIIFFKIVVFILHLFYIIGIIILFLDHVQSSKLNIVYKPNGSFSKALFINNLFDFKEKFKNNFAKKRKKNDINYFHGNYKRNNSNTDFNLFIESFNKKNTFIKPIYVTFQDDMNKSVASQNELLPPKKKKKNSEQNQLFLKSTKQKDIHEMTIDEEIENYDNIQMDEEEMNKEDYKESDSNDINNNNNYSNDINNNNNYSNDKNNNYYFKNMDDSEYDLINDYILLKKNGLTIKELMEQGKWACPKENLKMIRERVNSKINWNYILKKNNELLNDNVDKIYHGIYKKENVDDLLFVFDTYPYNYLNITMSVFSLYKFANSYLNEKKEKMNSVNEKKHGFFNNISSKNFLIKEQEDEEKKKKKHDMEYINEHINIKNNDNKSRYNEKKDSYDDNFFALENIQDDVGDNNIFKIKEERKRLNYITTNRNFQRIVGSINKHLKIIYRIFSSNEKLSSYEKNKNVYKYIPYINIKDIIIILKSFCILKYDHANIYKYIYFFIVHFIDKFDLYNLCQAVHLCIIKKIYIKPLYQNFIKYLEKIFEQGKNDYIGKIQHSQNNTSVSLNEKKRDTHEELHDHHNTTNKNNVKTDILLNIPYDNNRNNLCKNIISLYDHINIKDFYNNIENILEGYSSNSYNYYTSPLYANKFNYYIYHSCNYSNINNALDDEEEKKEKEKDVKSFMTKDMRKEKERFIEENSNKDITINQNKNNNNKRDNKIDNRKDINLYVYILYVLSKFPYSNVNIINKIISHIIQDIHNLSIDELILTFYSIAELEYEDHEVQNYLYLLIFQRLHLLNYRNNDTLLKLIKSLYLTNNLDRVYDDDTDIENGVQYVDKKESKKETQQQQQEQEEEEEEEQEEPKKKGCNDKDDEKKEELNNIDNENNNLFSKKNCDYKNHTKVSQGISFIEHINKDENNKMESIKILMIYVISKMILKNVNNYSPIELVDIIRYMSAFKFINKELFSFVYSLPFFKNLNEDVLNYYKNHVYFNQSYYAYTKNNNINTPIEIMLCKLYQSYLSYNMYIKQIDNSYIKKNVLKDDIIKNIYKRNNDQINFIQFDDSILQILKKTYLNNMKISSYASSSLHYEIADIINKDFKIPCHVEYKTPSGLIIDIAILYEDIKKINPSCPFFKNIAIEINGPFHYKTKSLNKNFPLINTKTILKKRLLQFENWDVISFPFWEIKPWFSKTRKESYILKMLPEKLKTFFK
ncbi:RAP protein, putative [Plasmodium sp. DRC-Itaito]|nr:RAP protein, putative [Plasmodium sp. DRC-Itaito]